MEDPTLFARLFRGGRGLQGGGRGQGHGNQAGAGPGGECHCPQCGFTQPHQAGLRCMDAVCPRCGTRLRRA